MPLSQKQLRKSGRRFQNILANFAAAYYEVDLEGKITFFNDSVLVPVLGRTAEELMGMNFKEVALPEDVPKIYHIFKEIYKELYDVKRIVYSVRRKDNAITYVEVSASLLKNDTGQPIGFSSGLSKRHTRSTE